jgi:hypothetical protein
VSMTTSSAPKPAALRKARGRLCSSFLTIMQIDKTGASGEGEDRKRLP